MMRRLALVLLTACAATGLAAAADKPDTIQGNWEGTFTAGTQGTITAKIIAEGDNAYRAIVEGMPEGGKYTAELTGKGDKDVAVFFGRLEIQETPLLITAEINNGQLTGKVTGTDTPLEFKLQRVEKKSPTLGMAPPAGAIVIFDGQNEDKWKAVPDKWDLGDGAMTVAFPTLVTADEFGSGEYHVEFKTPLMPSERGQGRGNSGVYVLGRYEVQVLDSFGLPPADNEAGGIYKMATPLVNASLPPEEWQTYDITFHAAKLDATGNKTQDASITVKHNGILIHDNVKLSAPTPGGVSDKDAAAGPLMLQNHGNRVSYRNIWYVPSAE